MNHQYGEVRQTNILNEILVSHRHDHCIWEAVLTLIESQRC